MNQLDVYYRALLNYRTLTTASNECGSLRSAIAEADTEQDKIVITRAFCTIDEDWVDAIEAGLVHIEKAIKEDRQFIRSNGEVVEIEKVLDRFFDTCFTFSIGIISPLDRMNCLSSFIAFSTCTRPFSIASTQSSSIVHVARVITILS